MKTFLSIRRRLLFATLAAATSTYFYQTPAQAAYPEQPIKLVVHGNNVETDVAPFIENGRTLVPVRVISETLGFKVQWIAEEEKVVIGSPTDAGSGNGIALFIGNATAYLNEHETVTRCSSKGN